MNTPQSASNNLATAPYSSPEQSDKSNQPYVRHQHSAKNSRSTGSIWLLRILFALARLFFGNSSDQPMGTIQIFPTNLGESQPVLKKPTRQAATMMSIATRPKHSCLGFRAAICNKTFDIPYIPTFATNAPSARIGYQLAKEYLPRAR